MAASIFGKVVLLAFSRQFLLMNFTAVGFPLIEGLVMRCLLISFGLVIFSGVKHDGWQWDFLLCILVGLTVGNGANQTP